MPLSKLVNVATPGDAAPRSSTWLPNTFYKAGQIVVYLGQPWTANADFTSGASFNASNWTLVVPGTEIVSMALGAEFTCTSLTFVNVTDSSAGSANWAVTVPANSGAIRVEIPSALVMATTGNGNAVGVSYFVQVEIVDELDARVAQGQVKHAASLTTPQVLGGSIPVLSDVLPNNASAKTYRVRMAVQVTANSSSGKIYSVTNNSSSKPSLIARRV